MRRYFSWPLPLAAVWLLLPLAGVVIAATIEPLPPYDYWWHLAMGRLLDATGAIPNQNYFLYTMPADAPFHDQPWFGQWLMWRFHDAFGPAGGIWLRNALALAAWATLLRATWDRATEPRLVGGLLLLSVVLAYPVLTVRTRMFAFVPFALLLLVLLGIADGRMRRRWVWLLVPATAFWANTHGSFVLAPVLTGVVGGSLVLEHLVEERRLDARAALFWSGAVLLLLAAGALSPHGVSNYAYVVHLAVTSDVATSVSEWRPPDPTSPTGILFLVSVVGALVVMALRRKEAHVWEVLLLAVTLWLSAGAVRSMFWWAATMPCIVAPHLRALVAMKPPDVEQTTGGQGVANTVVLTALVVVALLIQPGIGLEAVRELAPSKNTRRSGYGAHLLNHENPTEIAAELRRRGVSRVFHDQAVGGLLEFWLTDGDEPSQVSFVDQRMEFVDEDTWRRYFALSRAVDGWEEALTGYDVDALVLNPETQWPLVQAALASEQWKLLRLDHAHMAFVRR